MGVFTYSAGWHELATWRFFQQSGEEEAGSFSCLIRHLVFVGFFFSG